MKGGHHFSVLPLQVPSKTETHKHSLLVLDGVIAGVAHPDLELEAHDRVAGALAAALPTHRLPTFPAVMLQDHGREEKEEFNFCSCSASGQEGGSGEDSP